VVVVLKQYMGTQDNAEEAKNKLRDLKIKFFIKESRYVNALSL
jgi:hypothetical protein